MLCSYLKSYRGGGPLDWHFPILMETKKLMNLNDVNKGEADKQIQVLYPGCHRHLTPALVFSNIHFLDYDDKMSQFFNSEKVKEYVQREKTYSDEPNYVFSFGNYEKLSEEFSEDSPFHLLISLSAGLVSKYCSDYINPKSGFLLASDAHSDARYAFLSDKWRLIAVWDEEKLTFNTSKDILVEI